VLQRCCGDIAENDFKCPESGHPENDNRRRSPPRTVNNKVLLFVGIIY